MKRGKILTSILFISQITLFSQSCPNIDFNFNDFSYWSGSTGSCCPISLPTPGIVNGRHTIISSPGTDPNTGGILQIIPPGFNSSLRLGNSGSGSEAEGIFYLINVDAYNSLLIYKYAVILEDPGHSPFEQPRFEMVVKDQFNQPIICTEYLVVSNPNEPDFTTYNGPSGPIIWKDWTTVGVDLSAFIGQTVSVEAKTGDCSLGGHFGYAYFAGKCLPLQISLFYCTGDTVAQLMAPDGFNTYLWSTGDTTQSITVLDPLSTVAITCTITSFSGCQVVLNAPIIEYQTISNFSYETDCQGLVQFTDQSSSINGIVSYWNWNFGDGDTSFLASPVHQYADTGTYMVQLIANAGCPDTINIPVIVDSLLFANFSFSIDCQGNVSIIDSTQTSLTGLTYNWDFGDGSNSNLTNPTHQYSLNGNYTVTLDITDTSGCTSSLNQYIDIGNNFFASFSFDSIFCIHSPSIIFNQSTYFNTTTPNSFWYINSTLVDTSYNLNYTFDSDTATSIMLIISNSMGCLDTFSLPIRVISEISMDFTVSNNCVNNFTLFNYTGIQYFGSFLSWNFGDGNSTAGYEYFASLNYYITPGNYNVSLSLTYGGNCSDTIIKYIEIYPNPIVNFSFITSCFKEVFFTNTSNAIANTIFNWQFGDGNSTDNNSFLVGHNYGSNGTYNVILTATDPHGCIGSVQLPVTLNSTFTPPIASDIPNVIYQSSSLGNEQWDLENKFPEFNQCLNYTLYIYNRWGEVVFETTNYINNPDLSCQECFRGFSNINVSLSEGTYYYLIETDRGIKYKGFLTLFN